MQPQNQVDYDSLSPDEKALLTASSKLLKHFRGLEASNLLKQEDAASLIGCVMKIVSIARSKPVKDKLERIDDELSR